MTIAVVILNWNGRKYLEQFVPSVLRHSSAENVRIIVADNASTDDSVAFLQAHFPSVGIVKNEENGGYAKGYNTALKQVDADILVLLNSDVEVTEGWLTPMLEQFKNNSSIAAIQPKIKDFKDKTLFEYAGASGGFIDKFGYPFCRGRIFNLLEKDEGQYDKAMEIFWASGACLFIRKQLFEEIGGFDEDFFAHMEEIDLCWRLKNSGYQIWVEPRSVVYHVGGGTLSKISPFKTYLNFRNNLYIITKNLPAADLFPMLLGRLLLDGIAGIKFLLGGDAKHCLAVVKAHFAFYGKAGKMLRKRKGHHPYRTKAYVAIAVNSIVWKHFVERVKKYSTLFEAS